MVLIKNEALNAIYSYLVLEAVISDYLFGFYLMERIISYFYAGEVESLLTKWGFRFLVILKPLNCWNDVEVNRPIAALQDVTAKDDHRRGIFAHPSVPASSWTTRLLDATMQKR